MTTANKNPQKPRKKGQTGAPVLRTGKRGRPTIRTHETAAKICKLLALGRSLQSICRAEDMPDMTNVMDWLEADEKFRQQYARARELQAEFYAQQIIDIADDGHNDTYEDDEGHVHVDTDVIARSKLRVDARKWVAAKLLPKKYGDKAAVEVSGGLSVEAVAAKVRTVSPLLAARMFKRGNNEG